MHRQTYQISLPQNLILVRPLFKADSHWFASTHSRSIGSSPDLDDWNISAHLQVLLDDVTNLGFSDRGMLIDTCVRFHSIENLERERADAKTARS